MCGRGNNDDNSKESIIESTAETTPTSTKDDCADYISYSRVSGCNITIQGQLLLVLDSINATFRKYFSCFCKVVQARLNNTNITIEILAGNNQSTCDQPGNQTYVDQDLLQNKLTNLTELESQDKYAGMAVILTDGVSTAENSFSLSKDREPFLYFVNVGENKNKSGSCYRQYRYVENMTDIIDIGQELESIGCNNTDYMMNNNCIPRSSPSSTTLSAENQGVNLSMIVSIPVGGFLVAVLTIITFWIYVQKCKRQGKPTRAPSTDSSEKYSGVEGLAISRYSMVRPSFTNGIYNELREDEKRTHDDNTDDNYHHLDLQFVKEDVNPTMYDHVTVGVDSNKDITAPV